MEYVGISMIRKRILIVLALLLVCVGSSVIFVHKTPTISEPPITNWSLGISSEVAGCLVVGGERYGFATDLADSLSRRLERPLNVETTLSNEAILEAFGRDSINIAIIPAHSRHHFESYPTESLYTTNFTLLTPSWSSGAAGTTPKEAWRGKRILADRSFLHTDTFASLDSIGVVCDTTNMAVETMAQRLSAGKADAMICSPEVASLVTFIHRNIRQTGAIEEDYEVVVVFANNRLKEEFCHTLEEFSTTDAYATMVGIYFGEESVAERFTQLRYRPTRVLNGISIWDSQLKNIASQIGVDWRLMSAMAYHESRYRNDQVSHRGAVGLMQVTPIVAEEFKLEEGYDLSDPSTNITLAAKLLRRSSRALGFGNWPTTDDGLAIMVASYNCGITRTLEAQRLCDLYGYDKNSWADVSAMFRNMSSKEWIDTHDYRMRRFGDAEVTIAYTEGVMTLYNSYRTSVVQ